MNMTLNERIKLEVEKPLSMKKLEAKMRYIYRHQGNLSNEERVSEIRQESNEFFLRKNPFRCI